MSITIEESRLVDNAAMQQHRSKTGYDYGKQVQLEIQALVESEITIREISRSKPTSLLPRPGVYNGTIVVKKEDVLAYSEAHPQIACKPAQRKQIIEMLRSGATAKSLPKTKEQERIELSSPELSISKNEIKVKVNDANTSEFIEDYKFSSMREYTSWFERNVDRFFSVNRSADDKYDFELTGTARTGEQESSTVNPDATKDAHLLISQNSLYFFPAISERNTHITKTKTFARSSVQNSQDSILGEIMGGTELKVIDCHLGKDAKWAIVESEDYSQYGRFYIELSDIIRLNEKVMEAPKDMTEKQSIPDTSAVSIDWTTQSPNVPYFDARVAKHRVAVSMGITKLPKSQSDLEDNLAKAFRKGAKLILSNYGKDTSPDVIDDYERNSYYDNPIRVSDVFVDDREGSQILALVECPHRNLIRATTATSETIGYFVEDYDVSVFKDYIKQLTKKIDSFAEIMEKFPGEIVTFVPEKESENLSLLPATIDEVFKQNGIDSQGIFARKGLLTIRWNMDLKILGMKFEEQDGKTTKATRGLVHALIKTHMESKRTQNLLFNLNRICSGGLEESWTDFLKNYISYEEVKVIPQTPDIPSLGELEGPPIKTLDQLRKEENFYLNPERKIKEALKRENAVDFVGAAVLDPRNLDAIKDKVSGATKDAYKLFLNSVDFRKVVFKTVKGLVPQSATSHFDSIRREVDTIEFDVENYEKRIKTGLMDAAKKKFSKEIAQIEETQQQIQNGLDKFHKYQRQYQNFDITLRDLSNRQDDVFEYIEEEMDTAVEEMQNSATEVAEQLAESAEDKLLRQISETTGMDPNTVKGIKDKIPGLLGKKITFEEVTHFPEIVFSDNIPTDDISEMFVENLKNASSAMVNEMIKSLVKNTLDGLRKATSPSNRPNRQPESDLNLPEVSINPDSRTAAEEVFDVPAEKMENILDDTTNLLSPEELCGLFDGKPNRQTVDLVKTVMRSSYPELEITTASQISDFFNSLSIYTNFDSCRALIEAEVPDIFMDDFACAPNSSLREGILRDKGMSDDQIKKQLENERQRSRNLAEDLLDQLKNGLLSGGYEAPSDFCNKSSGGSDSNGQNSFMDENFRYSLRSTLNKTFETVYTSFKNEGQEYAGSLFQEIQSERILNDEPITILERRPLAHFEKFLKTPDIEFLQQFRTTRVTSPKQKLELTDTPLSDELRALQTALETESDSAQVTLIELPSTGNEISHSIQMQGAAYITTTPINASSGNYEFSSKGFLESMLVASYEELTNITRAQKDSLANRMTEIHNEIKRKIFKKIYSMMGGSPYLQDLSENKDNKNEQNVEFLLDYVNLGPQVTSECDPHLLKVTDEVDEIFNKFKNDMCAENVQTPDGVKPSKNALESSMMTACVRLTLRHYLIESLTRGLISMSTITGSNSISDLILDYVATKLEKGLDSYGRVYREDFYEQVKEIYSGNQTTTRGMITEMLREEYDNVSFFLYEALLLGDKTIHFKNNFYNRTPIIDIYTDNIDNILKTDTKIDLSKTPFIIVREDSFSTLCLALTQTQAPKPSQIQGHFYKKVQIIDFNTTKQHAVLLPLVKLKPKDVRDYNSIKRDIYADEKTQRLLNVCFPLDTYASTAHIHEMESTAKVESVVNAFGDTRDSLYSVFYTVLPQANDWKKENKILSDVAGSMGLTASAGLTALFDFNFGVFDAPVTSNTFNFGLPLPWGQSFKGLFFSFAAKAVKDAALKTFKDSVEKSDLNISLASKISKGMKLAGVNVSTTEISILIGIFPFPNPYAMTPASIIYNALGLGSFKKSGILSGNSEESNRIKEKIEQAGLKAPKYCREMLYD